jgi:hypothetical protein
MRRLALATAAALLLSTAPLGPAQADTPGCVTKGEFKRAKKGMKQVRVHRIFDTSGFDTGLGDLETRHYDPCAAGGIVQVVFRDNGRLKSKSGNWIS